jgi:hypothetical protein
MRISGKKGQNRMADKKSDETRTGKPKEGSNQFQPGGKFAPINDRYEYEKGMESLSPEEQELVKELTNFADLCKYFEEHNQELDPSFARAVMEAAKLPVPERTARIREINQRLMTAVNDAGEGAQFRN